MVRVLAGLLGVCCLAGAGAAVYTAATEPSPIPQGVYAETPVLDFGELAQAEKVAGEFKLVNRHPVPITVLDVLAGCSCTTAAPSVKEVPAGGAFAVLVNWSVGTRRGRLLDAVTVQYQTADGQTHLSEVGLTAQVKPDIEFTPAVLEFAADKPGTAVVKFTPGRMAVFRLQSAHTDQAGFRVTLDSAKAEVTVAFHPAAGWTGIGADPWLTVGTNSTREPHMRIPMSIARDAAKN